MHGPLNFKFNTAYRPQVTNWTTNICPGAQLCNCLWSTSVDICGIDITHGTFLHGSGYFKRLSAAGGTTGFEQNGMTVRSGNPPLVTNIRVYALQHIYMYSNKEHIFRNGLFISLHFSVLLKSIYCRLNSVQSCLPVNIMWQNWEPDSSFLTKLITSRWCKVFHLYVTKH